MKLRRKLFLSYGAVRGAEKWSNVFVRMSPGFHKFGCPELEYN